MSIQPIEIMGPEYVLMLGVWWGVAVVLTFVFLAAKRAFVNRRMRQAGSMSRSRRMTELATCLMGGADERDRKSTRLASGLRACARPNTRHVVRRGGPVIRRRYAGGRLGAGGVSAVPGRCGDAPVVAPGDRPGRIGPQPCCGAEPGHSGGRGRDRARHDRRRDLGCSWCLRFISSWRLPDCRCT